MDFLEDTAIVLERRGIKVFSESDGRQAFRALRRSPVDILLIDIDMPALSGFDLLARFRRNSRISSIPCIFLTGQTGSNSILQALRNGIDDYITKPFHSEELADRIETIVRKKKPSVHEESLFVHFCDAHLLRSSSAAGDFDFYSSVFRRACQMISCAIPEVGLFFLSADTAQISPCSREKKVEARVVRVLAAASGMMQKRAEVLIRRGDYLEPLAIRGLRARYSAGRDRSIVEQWLLAQNELLHS